MYKLLKPILFAMKPEKAHYFTFNMMKFLMAIPGVKYLFRAAYVVKDPSLEREVFGIKFSNPVGLAAGFDKDARIYNQFEHLGFGFIEIGTVTPKMQPGNPKPRLFRLPADHALINRMGFNNRGVEAAVERLKRRRTKIIIGGNIGKNKVTPNEEALSDYERAFDALHSYVDYFVVNVSSPNTPGLRDLQEKGPLLRILSRLKEMNRNEGDEKPILLKIAPDLTNGQLDDIIAIVKESGIDGVIATNTTIDREGLKTEKQKVEAIGNGGLSGKPVRSRSTEVIKYLSEKSGKAFPIIGVGGVDSPKAAQEKLDAGADLVQVYTGLIYEGPGLVKRINKALIEK